MQISDDTIDRRRFLLALGSAAASLTLTRTAPSQSRNQQELLFYVGTYTTGTESKGIYVCKLNRKDGSLLPYKAVEDVVDPSFLAIDGRTRYLYAVNETLEYEGKKEGSVSAFAIDQRTGDLTFLNRQPSLGAAPCHISISKDNRFILVANYVGGNLAVFPLELSGKLQSFVELKQLNGTGPNKDRQEASHAHSIDLDKSDRFAATCDLGADKVFLYRFNKRSGKLEPNPTQPYFQTKPGAGPRHFVFHQSGRRAFVINELDSTVTALSYNENRGALIELQTISTLPIYWTGSNTCAEIQISPDGSFLYGSNRGHDSIVSYKIDDETGKLIVVEHTFTGGKVPRNFAIDPMGQFLLVANQKSNDIVTFSIDRKTGRLRSTGNKIDVPAPVCIKFPQTF